MEYGLWGVLFASLQTAVFGTIRYWLFKDNLRISPKVCYALLFFMSFGGGALWFAGAFPLLPFTTLRALLGIIMFLVSCGLIKEPFAKHAFAYAFVAAYNALVEIIGTFAQASFNFVDPPALYIIACGAFIAVSFVPFTKSLRRMVDRLVAMDNDRVWATLCIICFSFLFMNLVSTFPAKPELKYLISRILMMFGMAAIYGATTRVMDKMKQAADARAALEETSRRIAMQQSYYERMINQMDEVRRMRHDLRHHRHALAALINAGDMTALKDYLDTAALEEETPPVTGNLAADSILLYYINAAKSQGVKMEATLSIGRETPLTDPDLCVILGNLLENALEAQRNLAPNCRLIKVSAKADKANFTLAVDNRFDGKLLEENGAFLSRKHGAGHGIGIESVRAVCEKYGGVLQIETQGDMFMAGVVIGL